MAPRVQFYHNTPDRLALTRELVSSAHERGRKVAICCADAAQLKRLDQLLWTGEPLSFIPHVATDSALAGETPVVLAAAGMQELRPCRQVVQRADAHEPHQRAGHIGQADPDIALVYANPAQMILLINGLQWAGYRKLEWGAVGESACADSWGRALATGEPSLALPCFPERRYGGVPDDELLMALKPAQLAQAVEGLKRLSANGLRYPIPPYGVQNDVRAGMAASYGSK